MKRQFRLIGLVALVVLSACNSKSKGPTDTYSSGVVSIAADESFEPIIQEEIEVFENLYPLAGLFSLPLPMAVFTSERQCPVGYYNPDTD